MYKRQFLSIDDLYISKEKNATEIIIDIRFVSINNEGNILNDFSEEWELSLIHICKEVSQEPPLLYDLTSLQKEANTKLNFSADKTLSIAQKLYEGKLISYPRTGSCYISQDVFEEIPERDVYKRQHFRSE